MSIRSRRAVRAISGALLALMLVVPGTVSAAVPVLISSWYVIPTTVNHGDYVALKASIFNDDNSTVSQLFLVEVERAGFSLVSVTINESGRGASCDTTTNPNAFRCTLGQLKPGKTATVTAVYSAPASGTSATPVWEFNTTGLGSGGSDQDQSHGDKWPSGTLLTVGLRPFGDFGGRYVLNNGLKIVENNQALSNANPHSTRAYSPVTGVGVTVEDIDCGAVTPDPLCATLAAGFGQISKINVNNDEDTNGITDTTLLHFYLQLDSSEIPSGVNANNVSILHDYPGGSETLSTRCTFARKATVPSNAPCISVKNLPGGDLGIDVWTFHNGGLRGNF